MDLETTAAIYIPIARSFQLGGNFYYRRNTESLVFSTYGKTDKTYKSLIDYGAFIGEVEEFGVERFTDHNRELPLFDEYFGGGAQVQWNIMPQLRWYNDVNVAHRTGYYGRKSPSTTQLSHHHSRVVEMASRLSFSHGNTAHELDFSLRTENLVNMEEHFREQKNEAGWFLKRQRGSLLITKPDMRYSFMFFLIWDRFMWFRQFPQVRERLAILCLYLRMTTSL